MGLIDGIRRRRADKLRERGYGLIEDGEYEEALRVAGRLHRMRYSGGFELTARVHADQGRLEEAVQVLEEGVEIAPHAWLNWQLLGNYRSDLGRLTEAEAAYERALACPGVEPSSVRLNQAILSGRQGDHQKALGFAGLVDDPALRFQADAVRMTALAETGREEEAEALGSRALAEAGEDADGAVLDSVVAGLARLRLRRGDPKADVRAFATGHWERVAAGKQLLAVVREIDGLRSATAQYFRLTVHGRILEPSPEMREAQGFYVTYDVVADTPDEALGFVRALDTRGPAADWTVDEAKAMEPRPGDPKGVYWASGRVFYEEE